MRRLLALAAAAAMILSASAIPAFADSAHTTADNLFTSGDFDDAGAAYAALLLENPRDVAALVGLGTIRLYQNDLAAAKTLLQTAVAADPSNTLAAASLRELQRRASEAAKRVTVAGGEADIPFVSADPLPVVRASINGKPGTFLIDTGASFILQPEFAKQAGLTPVAPQGFTVDSIALGGAVAYDVPVTVQTVALSGMFATPVDGIIGTTIFERFLATIDYPSARLILRPRGAASSEKFLAAAKKANASIEPCWLVGDHYVFAGAFVNDSPEGLFFFDSGLARGGLMPSPELVTAAKLKLDVAAAHGGAVGGESVSTVPFFAETIVVGTAVQHNVPGIYTPDHNPFKVFPFAAQGIISDLFLRHYAYTVDFDAMKIILAP